jgi:quercetin dioxygenase-like cupin family protein
MLSQSPGFILPAGKAHGQTLMLLGQTIIERITAEDTKGEYCVFDEVTPAGMGVPPHRHRDEDEVAMVRTGTFEVFLNGTVSQVGPGAVLNLARGSLHGFRCIGPEPGHTTWIVTPGLNFQTFIREVASFPPGPPDFVRLDALHARHGMVMAPPTDPWW